MLKSQLNDKLYFELQESWIQNQADIEEATATANKEVFFTDADIVDKKGKGIKLRAEVKGEDGSPRYIDLIVPQNYIRTTDEPGKMRLSSIYVSRAISNFNKGLYATGGIDVSTDYKANEDNKPTHKLKDLKIVSPMAKMMRYSKSGEETTDVKDQLVQSGVRIGDGENKKALITDSKGKAIIVNIDGAPHYLVGFEVLDKGEQTFRVSGEGDATIVATMPVPMNKISADGLISNDYVEHFISQWNKGIRYVWDGREGRMEHNPDAQQSPLSPHELASQLVDLDRFKDKFKQGEVGTQGADAQRHRLQNVAQKKLIDDSDIAKAEKENGKPFTREEFINFVKDKGIIPPDALRKDEFGQKLLRRWKQRNPRLASYVKSRKKAMGRFQADKDKYETPSQGKERMAAAHDAEEIVIDDDFFSDVQDDSFVFA